MTIITDKKRLTQILINLFSNAIKSFDYDQANKQIHLTFKQLTATRLQLHILDSGKGIDLQNAETLFNPFYKTENSEGIGLGLTICRLLLKKIGSGTIKFITPSKPEFSTELVAEFDIKQEPKHIVRPSIISRNIRDPILVLIDDNTTNLDLLKIIITNITDKNGYKVTIKTFNDPTAAKSFMLAHMNQIILCLLDMKMPKLTGVDLIRAIYDNNNDNINNNNNNTDKPIPFSFIIVSALPRTYITESIAQLPVQVQPNIVISSKPYNMQDIEKHIITVLKTKLFRITVV